MDRITHYNSFINKLIDYIRRYTSFSKSIDEKNLLIGLNSSDGLIIEPEAMINLKLSILISKYMFKNSDHSLNMRRNDIEESGTNQKYLSIPAEQTKLYSDYKRLHNDEKFKQYVDFELKLERKKDYFLLKVSLIIENKGNLQVEEITSLDAYKKVMNRYSIYEKHWFRGQSNSEWTLIPSMLRNLHGDQLVKFDYKELERRYTESELFHKYKIIFESGAVNDEFMAFMQHATGYSPFIDFTTSFIIATMFALSNKSDNNNFMNQDSAIYVLDSDSINNNFNENNLKIAVCPKSMRLKEFFDLIGYIDITRKSGASLYKIENASNDRMKYQKGRFIIFNEFALLNNGTIIPQNNHKMYKIVIKKKVKMAIYKYLTREYIHYNLNHLMNPYLYFTE